MAGEGAELGWGQVVEVTKAGRVPGGGRAGLEVDEGGAGGEVRRVVVVGATEEGGIGVNSGAEELVGKVVEAEGRREG